MVKYEYIEKAHLCGLFCACRKGFHVNRGVTFGLHMRHDENLTSSVA